MPHELTDECPLASALANRLRDAKEELTTRWLERISEAQRFMVGLLSEPGTARRAELASAERSGRVITPH